MKVEVIYGRSVYALDQELSGVFLQQIALEPSNAFTAVLSERLYT